MKTTTTPASSNNIKKKKPKQWRWAENDFPNRDSDYEVKVHKDEALPLIETWYGSLSSLFPPPVPLLLHRPSASSSSVG
jgi:hypothetical protein